MRIQLFLVISVAAAVRAADVCFDCLGCFSDAPPYGSTAERPVSRLPSPREVIDTQFTVATREKKLTFEVIHSIDPSKVTLTDFKPIRKTAFVLHSMLDLGLRTCLVEMCKSILQVADVNCISVDWAGGSKALYTQAVNNVRVVGAEVAHFINYLSDHYNYSTSNIHLIGHGLGAHVAGEAGKRCPGIARITGLDPSGPYFENTPPEVRLDPSDAILVDVIHTDASPAVVYQSFAGFGMRQLVGHLDFFPNGGKLMPGCLNFNLLGDLDTVLEAIDEEILCNHQRSITFFLQSILHPEGFVGYPGSLYSSFQEGAGFPCSVGSCAKMGYYADSYTTGPKSRVFFLNTGDAANVLCWRYRVMVRVTGTMPVIGSLSVGLCGQTGCSPQYVIHSGFIQSGNSYSSFIDVTIDVHPVLSSAGEMLDRGCFGSLSICPVKRRPINLMPPPCHRTAPTVPSHRLHRAIAPWSGSYEGAVFVCTIYPFLYVTQTLQCMDQQLICAQ